MGPTHFYRCRETSGNQLIDTSGNSRHALLTLGKDLPFNGQYVRLRGYYGDYATIPSTGLFNNPSSTGFSFMMWVSISDITSRDYWYRILDLASSNSSSGGPYNTLEVTKTQTTDNVQYRWSNSTWGDVGGENFGNFINNTWYHIAYTYKNQVGAAYLNGVKISQHTSTIAPLTIDRPYLFLGKASNTTNIASYITASYKDVAFFNKEISASDIAEVYDMSKPTTKIYGVANSYSIPRMPAKAVLVRSLPDNETTLCQVDQITGYWEAYVSKDNVYDVTAYGQDGSVYKPQIYGPMEI